MDAVANQAAKRGSMPELTLHRSPLQEISVVVCCGNAAMFCYSYACQALAQGVDQVSIAVSLGRQPMLLAS